MPHPPELVEGRDYVVTPAGLWQFTRDYLLRRGTCCGSGCRNCPYRDPPAAPPADPAATQPPPDPSAESF